MQCYYTEQWLTAFIGLRRTSGNGNIGWFAHLLFAVLHENCTSQVIRFWFCLLLQSACWNSNQTGQHTENGFSVILHSSEVTFFFLWPRASQKRIYYQRMWGQLSTTCSNVLKQPNGELLVAVNHNQLLITASETIDPIDWSHPQPSWAVPTELLVHSINQCNLSGSRTCNRSMWGNHLAYAATDGKE